MLRALRFRHPRDARPISTSVRRRRRRIPISRSDYVKRTCAHAGRAGAWCSPRWNSNAACCGRCSTRCTMPMSRRAYSARRVRAGRASMTDPSHRAHSRRRQAAAAARRAAHAQRGAGRLGAAGAGARVQGRCDRGGDPQALHRRGDVRRDRRRSRRDLQRAARAHRDRCRARCCARLPRSGCWSCDCHGTERPRQRLPAPLGLLAELTHRCPLGCPYCSNPLALDSAEGRTRHRDLGARVPRSRGARRSAGASLRRRAGRAARSRRDRQGGARRRALHQPDHLRRRPHGRSACARSPMPGSITCRSRSRTAEPQSADHIAGYDGAFARKQALAAEVDAARPAAHRQHRGASRQHRAHRRRWSALALSLGAQRVEIAHVQYYGWALKNRAALMPTREQVDARDERRSMRCASAITAASSSMPWCRTITRAFRSPAWAAGAAARSTSRRPARCCPATPPRCIPGLDVLDRCASIRSPTSGGNSPAFNAFRGTDWMQEPCRSCPKQREDFGGCRCQAFLLTGDARATDPVCHLSPLHDEVERIAAIQTDAYEYRGFVRRLSHPDCQRGAKCRTLEARPRPMTAHFAGRLG